MTEKTERMAMAQANAHIPSHEIEADIAATEAEIVQMAREQEGLRLIGDKISIFRADGRAAGIARRREFVQNLRAILEYRKERAV